MPRSIAGAFAGLVVAVTWLPFVAEAQTRPLGNEWINVRQTYYKIPVARAGLYRLTGTDLQRAGVPISAVDPATVQVFWRGQEQALSVAGGADHHFNEADYVEFYGQGNDGAPDSLLYRSDGPKPGAMPHSYYSLFSDTTAYFLTWRLDGGAGKRMNAYADTIATGLPVEPYHWAEDRRVLTSDYPAGVIYPLGAGYGNGAILTNYDVGEGWTGPVLTAGALANETFTLANYVAMADVGPRVEWGIVGRNAQLHTVDWLVGSLGATSRTLGSTMFANYNFARFRAELTAADVSANGTLTVDALPRATGSDVSVSYVTLRYPQRTDLGGRSQNVLRLRPNPAGRSWLNLTNAAPGTRLFDISDPANVIRVDGLFMNGQWRGVVRNTQTERTLLATSEPLTVPALLPVAFRAFDTKANYLIVTHPLLRQPAGTVADPVRAYATYRASAAGGGYDTLTVDIGQLFDQFSYGERHPLAIRRFADFMLPGGTDKFLFLIGQSHDPQGVRKLANGALLNLVPNAGWPGSDLGLVEGLNGEPANVPAMAVGRLNALRSQSVLDYLDKVRAHEGTTEPNLWRKNVLHLSGGRSAGEIQTFRRFVDDFAQVVQNQYVGGRVTTLSKQTDNPVEFIPVADRVNRGVGLLTLFGHSGLDVADVDLGFVSDDRLGYRNAGRYPFVLVNGCASGNFYFGRPTFGTDWILTPNRGAVGFLAHTYNGFPFALKAYSDQFYALFADSSYAARPVGQLQREAIRRYLRADTSVYAVTTAQQMTLQGDPAVVIFPFAKPDFAVAPGSLALTDNRGDSLTARSDSIVVRNVLVNYGRTINQPLVVRVRRYAADGQLLREARFTRPAPYYADTLRWRLINDKVATSTTYFEVMLDPDDALDESVKTNNTAQISTAGISGALPFPPDRTPPLVEVAFDGQRIADGEPVSAQPRIDVLVLDENPRLLRTDTTGLELYLQGPCAVGQPCLFRRLGLGGGTASWTPAGADGAFRLRYLPPQPLPDGRYVLEAIGTDRSGNRSAPYQIGFVVQSQAELRAAGAYPNPFASQTRIFLTLTGQTPPANLLVRINDITGRFVRTLWQPARVGRNEWIWDGTSDAGEPLPGGLYVYSIIGTDGLGAASNVPLTGRLLLSR